MIFIGKIVLQIDSDGVIWVMTNRLPIYAYASVDPNDYNYRIWKAPVKKAIEGTPCDKYMGNVGYHV